MNQPDDRALLDTGESLERVVRQSEQCRARIYDQAFTHTPRPISLPRRRNRNPRGDRFFPKGATTATDHNAAGSAALLPTSTETQRWSAPRRRAAS